jgi:hypothetical protein
MDALTARPANSEMSNIASEERVFILIMTKKDTLTSEVTQTPKPLEVIQALTLSMSISS